jgi:S1-C subfamily serine protease
VIYMERRVVCTSMALGALWLIASPGSAEDLPRVRVDLERALPEEIFERFAASLPLVFRGVPRRGSAVYRERVNGVVLIASTDTVGTGVVVSGRGDIVTNEHIVRASHKARGDEWVAVWFKPSNGGRPSKSDFLLARVLRKNQRRDLAHIQLAQVMPSTATVVPLASLIPNIGQEVFAIGHPKTYLWSFSQGVVSQIRPDYEWTYRDGIPRSATAIQTQAPVNPGNSGGPLLNDEGAVVGIVVGTATEMDGVSFAVSVQHVRELLPQ